METLERDLAELGRTRAPAGFPDRVLAAAGLADSYAEVDTPLGRYLVAWNRLGVCAVTEKGRGVLEQLSGRPLVRVPQVPDRVRSAIASGDGGRLRYDLGRLTEFERAVLAKTLEIPRGEVRTYGWVAREIGRPAAVRAVGTALGHNPVPILIPCHRVVRSDWMIGNYSGGGPGAKRTILAAEGIDPGELDRLARTGVRFFGSRHTHVFCVPMCRHARRIQPSNRVGFRDQHEAERAGYRPCAQCRPAAAARSA